MQMVLYAVLGFVGGLMAWTFFEYATHRWLLHGPLSRHHALHHRRPREAHRVQWWLAYPALIVLAVLFGLPFMWGVWVGLQVYEWFHARLHLPGTASWYVRHQQVRHALHHRYEMVNFGVTSCLWDRVFGTNAACN